MPTYNYTAKNSEGKVKKGTMIVKDEHSLAETLRRDGYILTFIERKKEKSSFIQSLKGFNFFQKISLVERMLFVRHLGVMIASGVSLTRALSVLAKQTKSSKFAKIINQIQKNIQSGESLSMSLERFPKVFDELFISMIEVGETSGNLEKTLKNLAKQMKKEHELISKVKGAMLYPAVVLVTMVGIGILMMVVVVPKLVDIFEELETELPLTTRIMIKGSDLLVHHGWVFLGGFIVFLVVFKILSQRKGGKKFFQGIILHLPVIGKIVAKVNLARFARGLGSLIESGEAILKALNIISQTLTNVYYRNSLKEISRKVEKGLSLHEALSIYPKFYPPLVTQMIEVGEETGTLEETLSRLAEFYEGEVDQFTKNLSSIIEPILVVIIGAAVGFFAVSMIQPMYSLSGAL